MDSQLRKVRCISYESALVDLDERGYPDAKPFAFIAGGLTGDATQSKLFVADGLIWEFEERPNGIRVYMHSPEDLQGNPYFDSYG